jgi:hypothetical protein
MCAGSRQPSIIDVRGRFNGPLAAAVELTPESWRRMDAQRIRFHLHNGGDAAGGMLGPGGIVGEGHEAYQEMVPLIDLVEDGEDDQEDGPVEVDNLVEGEGGEEEEGPADQVNLVGEEGGEQGQVEQVSLVEGAGEGQEQGQAMGRDRGEGQVHTEVHAPASVPEKVEG